MSDSLNGSQDQNLFSLHPWSIEKHNLLYIIMHMGQWAPITKTTPNPSCSSSSLRAETADHLCKFKVHYIRMCSEIVFPSPSKCN